MGREISVFGATGVVGRKSVNAACLAGYEIVAITGHKNYTELIRQAYEYCPRYVCCTDATCYKKVKSEVTRSEVLPCSEIVNIAKLNVDCCVMAMAGAVSLATTFACLGHARRLAIASKEAILLGGKVLIDSARSGHTEIIPLDSEHNAIFRCVRHDHQDAITEITLTASGGVFLNHTEDALSKVTLSDALKNPNWIMGKKVTVDSATLINKATEIIEASLLFELPINMVKYVIHPESIIHGIVRFHDDSYKALLSQPDMMIPIMYAVSYPELRRSPLPAPLNFTDIEKLTFRRPQAWQARNVNLAYDVFNEGKVVAFSIANEIAVSKFLNGDITFCQIYDLVASALDTCERELVSSYCDIAELIHTYTTRFTSM
jgi:1-deoxy-D-xylulose-5-phosphate reductoisomerase